MVKEIKVYLQHIVRKSVEEFIIEGLRFAAKGIKASERCRLQKKWMELAKREDVLAGVDTTYLGSITFSKMEP